MALATRRNAGEIPKVMGVSLDTLPILEEQNAWPLWHEAVHTSPSREEICEVVYQDERELWPNLGASGPMDTDHDAACESMVERAGPALDLLAAGALRGRLRFPRTPWSESFNDPFGPADRTRRIVALATLLLVRARLAAKAGRTREAFRDIGQLLDIDAMLLSANGRVVDYLDGSRLRSLALSGLRRLSALHASSEDDLRAALHRLEDYSGSEFGFVKGLLVDFEIDSMPELLTYDEQGLLKNLIGRLVPESSIDADSDMEEWFAREVDERARENYRDAIFRVLDGHPRPFDRSLTERWLQESLAEALTTPWSPVVTLGQRAKAMLHRVVVRLRRSEVRRQRRFWPPQFPCEFPIYVWSDDPRRLAFWNELRESVGDRMYQAGLSPTLSELHRARVRLRTTTNPFGWLLLSALQPQNWHDFIVQQSASVEGTRAVLALALYRRRHQGWPESWKRVVQEEVLSRPPNDPFTNRPLKFDAIRALVWSIGVRGANRAGYLNDRLTWYVDDESQPVQRAGPLREQPG